MPHYNLKIEYQQGDHAIRPLSMKDIEFVRSLRNDKKISCWLSHEKPITPDQQLEWYKKIYQKSPDQQRFILEKGNSPAGTLALISINLDSAESYGEAGIIIHPDYWGKKSSSEGLILLAHYAFVILGLDLILGRVRKHNGHSLDLLERIGLEEESQENFHKYGVVPPDETNKYFRVPKGIYTPGTDISVTINYDPKNLNAFPKPDF